MKMSSEPSSISSNEALLDDISLGDMRFLCALIESRSLTEAAKATASNLSSASRRLKRLRELLGDPIFFRSTPNMIPTARVLALEPVIRSIIRSSTDLLEPEVFSPATLKRTFRIGAVDNAIFAVMLGVLEKLCESAPGVSVEIRQIEDDLFDELASGAIDLAVLPSTRPILPSFREKLLYPVTYSLCVRKGHPLEKYWLEHGELPIEEISRYRKIVVSNRSLKERQQFVLDESRFLGRSVQDAAFSVPYFLAVPALLERTNFTAILPKDTRSQPICASHSRCSPTVRTARKRRSTTRASSGTRERTEIRLSSGCAASSRPMRAATYRIRRIQHRNHLPSTVNRRCRKNCLPGY